MNAFAAAGQQPPADRATDDGTVTALQQAMAAISAVCDHARKLDARGFSAVDAWLGHLLAQMPPRLWSDPVALTAWDMLRKYRGQLAGAGIDYDRLPRPAGAAELEAGRREQAREQARGHARQWRQQQYRQAHSYVRCDGEGEQVTLAFPYDPDVVAACRKIEGRRYDGASKTNLFPFTSLPAVIELASRHRIEVTADVRALAAIAADRAAERADRPQVRLDECDGTVIIDAPLDPSLYRKVKDDLGGRWDSAARVHRVAARHAPALASLAGEHGLRVSGQVRQLAADTTARQQDNRAAADAFEAEPVPVAGLADGLALKPQQYPVVRFALDHRRVLIGDDMGWGKTLSSLAAVAADGAWPAIVVCRPSLTLNWAAEARRFFPDLMVEIADGTTPHSHLGGAGVVIIGSAALAAKPRKTADGGREFGWVEELKKLQPKALIIDEGQDTKERGTNRSQACEQLAAPVITRDGLVLDLTGTAILNRPRELCQQLAILGRIGEFGGPKPFLWRYCLSSVSEHGADYNGARNLIELHDRLRAWGIMIRRSDDAALGLPPCREHVLTVPHEALDPDVMNRYRQAEADLLGFLADKARQTAAKLGKDPDSAAVAAAMRASAAEHLVAINTLRQLAGQAKRGYVTGWVRERVTAGEKVMVAAHHRGEVDAYAAAFGGLKLQGGQPVTEKEAVKARFQQQPASQAPVIAVAIGAGGVGHTLTAAAIGIQAEQAWTPGETQQMKKRLHRIGQDRPVDYYVTVAEGTIDEQLQSVVTAKQATLDAVLDGRSDTGTAADEKSVAAELTWRLTRQGLGHQPHDTSTSTSDGDGMAAPASGAPPAAAGVTTRPGQTPAPAADWTWKWSGDLIKVYAGGEIKGRVYRDQGPRGTFYRADTATDPYQCLASDREIARHLPSIDAAVDALRGERGPGHQEPESKTSSGEDNARPAGEGLDSQDERPQPAQAARPPGVTRYTRECHGRMMTVHAPRPGELDAAAVAALIAFAAAQPVLGLDVETSAADDQGPRQFDPAFTVRLVQFGSESEAWVLNLADPAQQAAAADVLADPGRRFVTHTPFDVLAVWSAFGIALGQRVADTRLLSKLARPDERAGHGLKELSDRYLDGGLSQAENTLHARMQALAPPGRRAGNAWLRWGWNHMPADDESYAVYAGLDAIYVRRLLPVLAGQCAQSAHLARMESWLAAQATGITIRGLLVDRDYTRALLAALQAEHQAADAAIGAALGCPGVSPRFADWLDKITAEAGITGLSRTPTGQLQVTADNLAGLADDHAAMAALPAGAARLITARLALSQTSNLIANLRGFLAAADPDGRVHPQVNTLRAKTARMSITSPALQTLKKHDPRLRRCFRADPGHVLITCDFSQIEIRVAAALSADPALTATIASGTDIHDATATLIYGPGFTAEQRTIAKRANFMPIYGGGARALAAKTGATEDAARAVIQRWKAAYPQLTAYTERLAGLPEAITASGRHIPADPARPYATANYTIQSTARDLLLAAIYRLVTRHKVTGLWLFVHDEIIVQAREEDAEHVRGLLQQAMTTTFRGIPIRAQAEILGTTWGQLKDPPGHPAAAPGTGPEPEPAAVPAQRDQPGQDVLFDTAGLAAEPAVTGLRARRTAPAASDAVQHGDGYQWITRLLPAPQPPECPSCGHPMQLPADAPVLWTCPACHPAETGQHAPAAAQPASAVTLSPGHRSRANDDPADEDDTSARSRVPGDQLREAARRYLEVGLLPVPAWAARQTGECCCPRGARCDRPGKHPRSVHTGPGPHDYSWKPLACRTHAEIDHRFAAGGEYAAGNLMVAIPEGMMAIDRDDDDGGRSAAAQLAGQLGELPPTLSHHTPHGEHLIYRTPPGWTGRAWVGKDPANPLPPGIDLRMPGQILMAAPSMVPGPDGPARYGPVTGEQVAALPAAYVTAWTPPRPQAARPAGDRVPVPPGSADRAAKYVHDAMTGIADDLASHPPGGRNNATYDAGLKAGSLLGAARTTPGAEHAAAAWSDEQAEEELMAAAERNGYTAKDGQAEARRAIRSGLRNGLRNPRTLPDFTTCPATGQPHPDRPPAVAHGGAGRQLGQAAAPSGWRRGRWQDAVPEDIRRQIEAADKAAGEGRRAAMAAHHQAAERHARAATPETAAEVDRTRAAAEAAHQAYTRDGRHVTGRHDAAMLRWAAEITAQRDHDARQPGQAGDAPGRAAVPPGQAGRWQDCVPGDIRRQLEAADKTAGDRHRAAIAAHHQALERHARAATPETAAEVEKTRAAAEAAHQAYTRDGRHITGRHDAAMLRWAAEAAAQQDQDASRQPGLAGGARRQANLAAVAANEAYKAGDLQRARQLTDHAAALDPSRAVLWQQIRNDIAARRLVLAARAAHVAGDQQRAGKLFRDARQLDPRLRTLWDGSLPAQPAARPQAPGRNPGEPHPHGTASRSQPAAPAGSGVGTRQQARASAPVRRKPDQPAPGAPEPGTTGQPARRHALAARRQPRPGTAFTAEDSGPDAEADAGEEPARWPAPNPRSQKQAGTPQREGARETGTNAQAVAEGSRYQIPAASSAGRREREAGQQPAPGPADHSAGRDAARLHQHGAGVRQPASGQRHRPAVAQLGEGARQTASRIARGHRHPGRQPPAQVPSAPAPRREPRPGTATTAEDPGPDADAGPGEEPARWPAPNPRSQKQADTPRQGEAPRQAEAASCRSPAMPETAPAPDWRDDIIKAARDPRQQPGPSWPHDPALHRAPGTPAPGAGTEAGQ